MDTILSYFAMVTLTFVNLQEVYEVSRNIRSLPRIFRQYHNIPVFCKNADTQEIICLHKMVLNVKVTNFTQKAYPYIKIYCCKKQLLLYLQSTLPFTQSSQHKQIKSQKHRNKQISWLGMNNATLNILHFLPCDTCVTKPVPLRP